MTQQTDHPWFTPADDARYAARIGDAQAKYESLANMLLGATVKHHGKDIPKDQLRWLKGFLRDRLSGPEFRVVATMYGWRGPEKRTAMIQAKASAMLRAAPTE